MNWIDNTLGLYSRALVVRTERAEIIAGNIANADTPRYKARELDFASAMKSATGASAAGGMRRTHTDHIASRDAASDAAIYLRDDSRMGSDGNTVQMEVEKAAYVENAVNFQANAQFFDGSLRTLRKALRGE
ncbi:MAG: flagellar basal body rod protein FlgB [Halieaceae bacterium]